MKNTHLFFVSLAATCLLACASPEQRATDQIDTTTVDAADTAGTDTVTNVNGRSGDNGTGTDTTSTAEQKAIREQSGQ
ncbi:MAG: hypothetical protein EOO88_36790 [Pedobacter sp.]|nr:MAG: hypothetical protein EOO88_36790 [Pedobacter sp.]